MMDAEQCPVVKSQARKESVDNAICPVVGAVSAYLPPTHPKLTEKEAGSEYSPNIHRIATVADEVSL